MDFVAARIDRVPHNDLAVTMGTTVPGYTERINPMCKRAPNDDEAKKTFFLLLGR